MPGTGAAHPGPGTTRVGPAFLCASPWRTVIAMTTTTTLPLTAGRWALDPAHSSVGFTIRHLGVAKVRGHFRDFAVDVVVGDDMVSTHVEAVIQVASVDTGNADRDAHIQADDMVDVARRPTLSFRSTAIEPVGDDWSMVGDLTIGDVTREVGLIVELGGIETFPVDGRRHAGFEARGEISRKDFGLMPSIPAAMIGDAVKIEIDLQLLEPADETHADSSTSGSPS